MDDQQIDSDYGPEGHQDGATLGPCCDIEIDFSGLSDLCTLMPRRLIVSGIFVQWLRRHFSKTERIENPLLQDMIWDEAIEATGIIIDTVYRYNPAQCEGRPGIFIKPNSWKPQNRGIANKKMFGTPDPLEYHVNVIEGAHTIFCVAGESAEVELLAAEVYKEIMGFENIARKEFNFLRLRVADIGEPAILEEATENFVVPVDLVYGVQEIWRTCDDCCEDSGLGEVTGTLWQQLLSD